ncbi:energy-coupling factor ABC transporter substrate-binding protein [Acetobacterium wieringae]|uniref:energy-coupling factor ABC transporter substrate-binding protein n=1 Tax=Acetobacterium wieringae TaxID=52694 RepID=UPI0026EED7CD|nr:energy-coupling factor ABC transporter substrate-binding protein [Acetobacterium wieringae]
MSKTKKTVIGLLLAVLVLIAVPLLALPGAQFEGADGGGSVVVNEIQGGNYEPWFTPVMESVLGGPIPGEMQSLFFCIQTGIGVGIMAFLMGKFVERKKSEDELDKVK